jgi:hypothetical protein
MGCRACLRLGKNLLVSIPNQLCSYRVLALPCATIPNFHSEHDGVEAIIAYTANASEMVGREAGLAFGDAASFWSQSLARKLASIRVVRFASMLMDIKGGSNDRGFCQARRFDIGHAVTSDAAWARDLERRGHCVVSRVRSQAADLIPARKDSLNLFIILFP